MVGSSMSLRAVGPDADGRLPLSEVARFAGELQSTLERLALSIRGSPTSRGRRPREVAEAVRFELVGFRAGSAVLEMAPPDDEALFNHDLQSKTQDLLFAGLDAIGQRKTKLPQEFTPQVLDGLIRLSGGISPKSVHRLELSRDGGDTVVIDGEFRNYMRWLRKSNTQDVVTIVGRLHEGDFDPLTLRCRIDTVDTTITCSFANDMKESILAAMGSMVSATGIAEIQPDDRIRTLDLDDLTVIDEAQRRTIGELAEEQGIRPVADINEFATMPDLNSDELDNFIAEALSTRS